MDKIKRKKKWLEKKNSPANLKKECDEVFSKIIRYRDKKCAVAGCTREDLQNAHFIERDNLRFRYDEKNCKAMCFKHHIHWWHSRDPFTACEALKWLKTAYPATYAYCRLHVNDTQVEKIDYKALKEVLLSRLKLLEEKMK